MGAVVQNAMPTLSQLEGWRADHLVTAAGRWRAATDTWTTGVDEVVAGLPSPGGTAWDGSASDAAAERISRDEAAVHAVAERLRLAVRIAQNGAHGIEAGKGNVLQVVQLANAFGYDVREDLSVVDRVPVWPPGIAELRARQAGLIAANVRAGAARLAAFDQQVATDLDTVTRDFVTLDFAQDPVLPPIDPNEVPSFGQRWHDAFYRDLRHNVLQGSLTGAITGAVRGAASGFAYGPGVAASAAFSGALSGAATGALTGVLKTAVLATLESALG